MITWIPNKFQRKLHNNSFLYKRDKREGLLVILFEKHEIKYKEGHIYGLIHKEIDEVFILPKNYHTISSYAKYSEYLLLTTNFGNCSGIGDFSIAYFDFSKYRFDFTFSEVRKDSTKNSSKLNDCDQASVAYISVLASNEHVDSTYILHFLC